MSIYNLAEYLATGECKGHMNEKEPQEEAPDAFKDTFYGSTTSRKRKVRKELRGLFDSPMGFTSDMLCTWKDDIEFQYELFREIEALLLAESIEDIKTDSNPPQRPFATE